MEKSKKSYIRALFKGTDVFLSVVMGLVVACGLYYVDHHNFSTHISPTFVTYFLPMCKAGLVFALVAVVGLILCAAFRKTKIQIADSLLVGLISASIGGLISFKINKCSKFMINLWLVTLIVALVAFAIRLVMYHKIETISEDEENSSKNYFALFARKYNAFLVFAVGALLGLVTMFNVNIVEFAKTEMVLYVIGAVVSFSVLSIAYTVLNGKKSKVNVLDVALVLLAVFFLMLGGLLISTRAMRYDALWAMSFGSLLMAIIVRSVLVSVNTPVEVEGKNFKNYYGLVFERFGVFLPVFSGILIGLLMDLCGNLGLRKTFERPMTSYFGILAICIIAIYGILFIVSLLKKGFTSKKASLIDLTLATGGVASVTAILLLKQCQTPFRYCIVLIPLGVCLLLTIVRMRLVDVTNIEPIADDEISLRLKIVVDDDKIKAYCNDKEIAVIDNSTKVKEEPVVEKVEEEPVVEKVENQVEEESEDNDDETDEEEEKSEEVSEDVVVVEEEKNRLTIAKRSFENKIKFTSDKTKNYYSILKNELLSFRTKSKISRKSESFRKKGLMAKISVSGKSLRIHLAIDPKAFDENKYHQIDLGEKKAFRDVPFTMKIRSDLACRRAVELIQFIASERRLRKNSKYEVVDFTKDLDVDGAAILEKVGQIALLKDVCTKQEAEALTDDVMKFIPRIKMPKALNEEVVNVYIDTALKYVENTISEETLHEVNQIPSTVSLINVKARTGLDKKVTVVCDSIDPTAAKVIILTGGKVFLIDRI